MSQEDILYTRIVSTTHATQADLVCYLQLAAVKARAMSRAQRLAQSGDSQFRQPRKPGESLAAKIHQAMIVQENLTPELDEICDIAQEVMAYTSDEKLWAELLAKIDML